MRRRFVQHGLRAMAVTAATALLMWVLSHTSTIKNLEAAAFDIRQIAFAPATRASDDIVMVWLDEPTMQALPYRSPVPRDFLAQLTERIAAAGPQLIGFDIFFKDPSFPEADRAFAKRLQRTSAFAVVPQRASDEVDFPLPLFHHALQGVGLADFPINPFDATLREAQYAFDTTSGIMPSFAAKLFEAATGKTARAVLSDQGHWPHLGPVEVTPFLEAADPQASNLRTWIRFVGPPGSPGNSKNSFKMYSAQLLMKGILPLAWLKDKIVLVGAGYDDLKDAFLTPYYAKLTHYQQMNGVEVHANMLSNLLTQQFYYRLAPWQHGMLMIIAFAIVAGSAVSWSPVRSFLVAAALLLINVVLAVVAFRQLAIVVPMVMPALGIGTSLGLGVGWRALTEGKQKRWIQGVFARYVPPQVVERMTENPQLVQLGGEERMVTSFFSDIASFTTISEKLDPTTLVQFLNAYLGKMNEVLFRHGATLDKYEGDAIIAFFNAPMDLLEHEKAAIRSALEIQSACCDITATWRGVTGCDIVTRIGINTGPAVVGNMGSESRFDYTAIGDTINLASRLEGTNKFYGTRVMCSETTARGLDASIVVRPVDRVRVKGKTEPILLYEVCGFTHDIPNERMSAVITPYGEAFAQFEKRHFSEAQTLVERVLSIDPQDCPTLELKKRLELALAKPSWDLITDLMSK